MFMSIYKSNQDPELLIGATVYGRDGEVYRILNYYPDRGFLVEELVYTDTDCSYYKQYPGYLTKRDLAGLQYYR